MLLTAEQMKRALQSCADEPIHIPGAIQAHGVLLALREPEMQIVGVSENAADHLGAAPSALLGLPVEAVVGAENALTLAARISDSGAQVLSTASMTVDAGDGRRSFNVALHRASGLVVMDLETSDAGKAAGVDDPLGCLRQAMIGMRDADGVEKLAAVTAEAVRALTGFDRVDVYQFGDDWSGHVIGEARADNMHGFLDWRFPAADIPEQARALYAKSFIRLIPDIDYIPARILAAPGASEGPLDLTFSTLRSVSPVHLTYLRNMGVGASMSVSIEAGGRLWGLIACHHAHPWFVPVERRRLAELVAQSFSTRLAFLAETARTEKSEAVQSILGQLIHAMRTAVVPTEVLFERRRDLAQMMDASALIIQVQQQTFTSGETPSRDAINALLNWLRAKAGDASIVTNTTPEGIALDDADTGRVGGVLACPMPAVRGGWIVWLRGERHQTYKWAGNPGKAVEVDAADFRVTPRASFALYETQHARSAEPWTEWEIVSGSLIAQAISETVMRYELERSNTDLERFAYAASHDLQEPLRAVTGYADLLRRRYDSALDDKGRHYLDMTADGAARMKDMVAGLLEYSRVSALNLEPARVDLNTSVQQAVTNLTQAIDEAGATLDLSTLPPVNGDARQIERVFQNLIANALKFRRDVPTHVTIFATETANMHTISIADNGIGIPPDMQEHVFVIFRRGVSGEEVAGLGLGLAMCKRIIQRHGGRIWVESDPGRGSTFHFTLPAVG